MNIDENSFRLVILGAIFVTAIIAESLWPLRPTTQPKLTRLRRNLGVAAVSAVLMRLLFLPMELGAASLVTRESFGLLNLVKIGDGARLAISLLLLDYTLYIWHVLNHRVPFLWRFHNAHHTDLDLDASTATRFHFGELTISSFYRVGIIFLLGIDVQTLLLFESMITAFALFHHANVRFPATLEKWTSKLVVGPRMHGIHHSVERAETDSNFGTILSIWDKAHSTLRVNALRPNVVIGVPSYQDPKEQSTTGILLMPFRAQRPWAPIDDTDSTNSAN